MSTFPELDIVIPLLSTSFHFVGLVLESTKALVMEPVGTLVISYKAFTSACFNSLSYK